MKKKKDTVSIVIPTYNEEKYIHKLIESILKQDYDIDLIEIIFVDGNSNDKTVDIIKKKFKNVNIKHCIINNPKRLTPISVNMGIKKSNNDIIIRLDAHSEYPTNYISKCVHYLETTGADNVGCISSATSTTKIGLAIADVLSSKFGVGNSKFRTNAESGYVDTVPFGCFRKELVDKIGYFDEELIRSEDNEFNYRIIKNGGKVYLFNDISTIYYVRDSIIKLMKMGFTNGKWGIYTGYIIPGSMKIRHFIPFLFTLSIIIGTVINVLNIKILEYLFFTELILYFLLDLLFSFRNIKKGVLHCLRMLITYPLFHISYGAGSIIGLGKIIKKQLIR